MKRLRSFLIVLILIGILAIMAPFFIKGPDGRPMMTLDRLKGPENNKSDDIKLPSTEKVKEWGRETKAKAEELYDKMRPEMKTEKIQGPPTQTMYKWKDKDGIWHYTDKPPPEGIEYQVMKGSQ